MAVSLVAAGLVFFIGKADADKATKLIAEVLTFLGTIVTAVVSIMGILLKDSFDRQSARRSRAMKKMEEERLRQEAATQVIGLFATQDGKEAPLIQLAGALITLAKLRQYSLAIDLTQELLARKKILGATTIALVAEQALQQKDERIQIEAMDLLCHHPKEMLSDAGFEYPMSIWWWDAGLVTYVRQWAPIAMGRVLMQRPLSEWQKKFPGRAYSVLAALAIAWLHEDKQTQGGALKSEIGAIFQCLHKAFPGGGILPHPRKDVVVDLQEIERQVTAAKVQPRTESGQQLIKDLTDWGPKTDSSASRGPQAPPTTGARAAAS